MRSGPLATVSFVLVAAACATPATPPVGPAQLDTVLRVDTILVTTESAADAALEAQVGSLQIQLLERDARLANMQEQLDATRQEVVRNLAKLQSQASRAEAASGMAEAEIGLETLGRSDGGRDLSEFAQAEALIAESSAEFGNQNYGGAVYLASQARALARSGQSRLSEVGARLRPGETLFATPVPASDPPAEQRPRRTRVELRCRLHSGRRDRAHRTLLYEPMGACGRRPGTGRVDLSTLW